MEKFFGIDIGGTNVKIGLVTSEGEMLEKTKYPTSREEEFVPYFIRILRTEFEKFPEVKKVGVGIPGVISKDRTTLLEIPNIPNLNGVNLKKELDKSFPGIVFHLENDAAAAALGEYYFARSEVPEDYIFITLGTGVGGGVIIDHEIFKGGDGNGVEIGHILVHNKKTLEMNIGKQGIMNRFYRLEGKYMSPLYANKETIQPKEIAMAALAGDEVGLKIFHEVGEFLGESLVSAIRLFDIKTIIIGGGLAVSFDIIKNPILEMLNKNLTSYYTKSLLLKQAELGNDAGIMGAASLCYLN